MAGSILGLKFKKNVELIKCQKSFIFFSSTAVVAGAYTPLGNLPLALFFGITPGFQFYNTVRYTEDASGTTKSASRALVTSAFWTGKIGISVLLPEDMVFDITLNVNPSNQTVGLSALMSVSL